MSEHVSITVTDSTGREDESWDAAIRDGELSIVLVAVGKPIPLTTIGESMATFAALLEAVGDDNGTPCTAYLAGFGLDDSGTVRIKAQLGPKVKRKRRTR